MCRRKLSARGTRIERLESRQMMAGDVFVNVVDGNLIVEGDAEGNQVAITAGPEPGSYLVRGLDGTNVVRPAAEVSTPVNEVVVKGVTGGARIALGAGDDRLVLANASFQGGVSIRMGEGNDGVAIGLRPVVEAGSETPTPAPGSVRIGGPLNIGTGEGNDRVHVDQAGIGGPLNIETGGGNDAVRLGHQSPTTAELTADAVETDAKPEIAPALRVMRAIHINLGAGNDEFNADAVSAAQGMNVNAGEGSDALHLDHVWSSGPLTLIGGPGDGADTIELAHARAAVALINTGAGNDRVRILDSAFRVLGVALETGDDTLAVGNTKAEWAFALGGDGSDTLKNLGGNRFGHRFVRGFETIVNPEPEPAPVA